MQTPWYSVTFSVFLGTYTTLETPLHLNTAICIHGDRYGKYCLPYSLVAMVASICRTSCLNLILVCLLWSNTSKKITKEDKFIWLTVLGALSIPLSCGRHSGRNVRQHSCYILIPEAEKNGYLTSDLSPVDYIWF